MRGFFSRLWDDDRAQSTTEYILILSAVVMIALKFKSSFSAKLSGILDKLGGNIDSAMTDDGTSN